MLIIIDSTSGVPIYQQVVEQVRLQVASGLLRPGEELPSTRGLSQELGVNPMTVSKAYVVLEKEGYLTRRPGLPLVVRSRSGEETRRDRQERLSEVLAPAAVAARQLGVGEEEAVEVFRRVLRSTVRKEGVAE